MTTAIQTLGASLRKDFPIFSREVHGKRLVYLDNAATTQKPLSVIEALSRYYSTMNANVHRGIHTLAEEATGAYEGARKAVARFLGARPEEVVFTKNATEAINFVALGWARHRLKRGDAIVLTEMEHHANLVPWILLAREIGLELRYIPIDAEGKLRLETLAKLIDHKVRLVALVHASNVLGTINPVEAVIEEAKKVGAKVLVDAAQSLPHLRVNVRALDCDFLAFSAHKMLGPTGVGVLYGKMDALEETVPVLGGGEMIERVTYDSVTFNQIPLRFEAGTPNIADVVAFLPALAYLEALDSKTSMQHEQNLSQAAIDALERMGFRVLGPKAPNERVGVVSWTSEFAHPHDTATILDQFGVAVRAGHHCAQPLMRKLGLAATTRASFYIYNDMDDVEMLIEALKEVRSYFG
jgi:cysteine desulfurase/selenocysteine lyase